MLHNAGHLNFFGQFAGRKRWSMALPSETAYVGATMALGGLPAFVGSTQLGEWWERVRRYEVVLEPGDLLINPAWTWHATEALGGGKRCSSNLVCHSQPFPTTRHGLRSRRPRRGRRLSLHDGR